MSDLGGAAHLRLHVWADPSWAVTMPDVLEGQCRGIRGWKYEMNGSQLVLLSHFCLNRVDVRSVEMVQRKLLVLRSRRPASKRWNSGKNRGGEAEASRLVRQSRGYRSRQVFLVQSPSPAASDNRLKPVSDLCGRAWLWLDWKLPSVWSDSLSLTGVYLLRRGSRRRWRQPDWLVGRKALSRERSRRESFKVSESTCKQRYFFCYLKALLRKV